jgi:hypothetical protein
LVVELDETSAQSFMPGNNLVKRPLQRFNAERASQSHANWNIVIGAAWLQLIEEPQALLGEGERRAHAGRGLLFRTSFNAMQ